MKMTKKKIFAISLIVCAIAILSMGTLAWFTAQDGITNNFMVGNTLVDPNEVFGLDAWETVDGVEIGRGTSSETGKTYMEILPGDKFNKVPVLENTGIHPQFVRATVTVSDANIWKEAIGGFDWFNWDNFFEGKDDGQWVVDSSMYNPASNEIIYVLYYQKVLVPDNDATIAVEGITEQIFDTVKIPTGLTVEQAIDLNDFNVSIYGEAIQSEHLGVATAKEAFETYWEDANTPKEYLVTNNEYSGNITPTTMDTAWAWSAINGEWESDPTVAETLFTATGANATNGTFHFVGGNYTLQAGDYLVAAEDGASAIVVYVWDAITVNGTEVPRNEIANYFDSDVLVIVQY